MLLINYAFIIEIYFILVFAFYNKNTIKEIQLIFNPTKIQ
jgi:hypothetical protein